MKANFGLPERGADSARTLRGSFLPWSCHYLAVESHPLAGQVTLPAAKQRPALEAFCKLCFVVSIRISIKQLKLLMMVAVAM